MNYYIQGDAANADKIKAAFEKLGISADGYDFSSKDVLYFTYEAKGETYMMSTLLDTGLDKIILTHPDYKELELPKPHYDISNFKPFDKVLIRDGNGLKWTADLFSYIDDGFVCTGGIPSSQCIPFNEETKHLLGTTDMCDEQYINW